MIDNLEVMKELAQEAYTLHIQTAYGDSGVKALQEVMKRLLQLYTHVTPDSIRGSLIVFKCLEDQDDKADFLNNLRPLNNLSHLAIDYDPSSEGMAVIQIQTDGTFLFCKEASIDTNSLSEQAIVYLYQDQQESFIVRGKTCQIPNPSRTHLSIFARPTFHSLSKALEDYKRRFIRTSRCEIFSTAWDGGKDSHRLFFVNKPESIMRKSLAQYLHCVLKGAMVLPEQNVDESHPVDVEVSWDFTQQIAIIEIKWMGDSRNANGDAFTSYRDARANAGAKQLAEYLDAKHKWVPMKEVIGYLVVIDARRRRLTITSTSINRENGLWYQDKEVSYNPEYHILRCDFEKPIRMFAEPICRLN